MQPLTGFRDFLPASCAERNYIFAKWREVAGRYGFVEFDGPVLEELDRRSAVEDLPVNGVYRAGSDHRKDGQAVGW